MVNRELVIKSFRLIYSTWLHALLFYGASKYVVSQLYDLSYPTTDIPISRAI